MLIYSFPWGQGSEQRHHFLSLWQFLFKHRQHRKKRCAHKSQKYIKKHFSVCCCPSRYTGINILETSYSFFHFSHPLPSVCGGAEWVWDRNPPSLQRVRVRDISVCFIFLLPGSSGLFVSRLVERFPLTNLLFQTISSSAVKGNSESDVILTATCIAWISVINYSCGVSKISAFFTFQSLGGNNSLSTPESSIHCQVQSLGWTQ